MQDITEFERRITSALERIDAGLDGLGPIPVDIPGDAAPSVDVERLVADLEAERALAAQLEERLAANRTKTETGQTELRSRIEDLQTQLAALEEDRGRLKAVNDALRDSNRALRDANEAGLGDDGLINRGLQTELDALRQVRQSDRAELDAVMALLAPALAEAEHETEGAAEDA